MFLLTFTNIFPSYLPTFTAYLLRLFQSFYPIFHSFLTLRLHSSSFLFLIYESSVITSRFTSSFLAFPRHYSCRCYSIERPEQLLPDSAFAFPFKEPRAAHRLDPLLPQRFRRLSCCVLRSQSSHVTCSCPLMFTALCHQVVGIPQPLLYISALCSFPSSVYYTNQNSSIKIWY
jgi:hypothetical protein